MVFCKLAVSSPISMKQAEMISSLNSNAFLDKFHVEKERQGADEMSSVIAIS